MSSNAKRKTNAAPQLRFDGQMALATQSNLEGTMSRGAVATLFTQCRSLMEKIAAIYASEVKGSEIGISGSGKADNSSPGCPVGLLYGRVQSGKTNAMVLSTAIALDNGFKTIVVLTSDVVDLVEQTRTRFETNLTGPLIYSSEPDQKVNWKNDRQHAKMHMPTCGMVIICQKNQKHIKDLIEFLHATESSEFPALIMDDEADQATPDTQLRSRARARGTTETVKPSRIHGLAFGNDPQITSLRSTLRHNFFLQVTATPQALLLQPSDAHLRPKLKFLLEPGAGYVGGDYFFDRKKVATGVVPIVFLEPLEPVRLENGETPDGLKKAVAYFLLASAALTSGRAKSTAMLFHTSVKVSEHSKLQVLLNDFVASIDSTDASIWQAAYAELQKSVSHVSPLPILKAAALRSIPARRIHSVNYTTGKINYGPGINFIIGGNILGRGLTIQNLMVTYYLRTAGIAQMDTMHQHARMYGYRTDDRTYLRVFLTRNLAQRFNVIHESEQATRNLIATGQPDPIPVLIESRLRATRPSVIDPDSVGVIWGGRQVYPILPVHDSSRLPQITSDIDADLTSILGAGYAQNYYHDIDLDQLIRLIERIPVHQLEPGSWNFLALEATLRSFEQEKKSAAALLYVRHGLERKGPQLETGALSGKQNTDAKSKPFPVLFLFKEDGNQNRGWSGTPFWYPTVAFPNSMRARIYSEPKR
jgi:hypothetical protein